MKALLLENSRLFHLFLSDLFQKLGFQPVVVDSRESALLHLERESYDIVCMNKYFEGGTGMGLIRELRDRSPHTPVLLLTSDDPETTRDRAYRAGITEVIFKSDMKQIARSIADFVQRHGISDCCGGRVLYVDRSANGRSAVARGLRAMGLEVVHCSDGEEVLARVSNEAFDLLISDVLLEGRLSGLELVRAMRTLPGGKAMLPVLTVTDLDDRARQIELLRAGANDYVTEPILEEELQARVTNLIRHKRLVDRVVDQQARMYELEIIDSLTGCYNRHGLMEFSHKYLSNARRRGESLSIVVLDVDELQQINSKHGTVSGDTVLKEVGGLLRGHCRAEDFVARYEGDAFMILLGNCGKQAAMLKAGTLRQEIEQLAPNGLRATVSVGVTHTDPWQRAELDAMFAAAERAVRRAKQRGRNCVSYRPSSGEVEEPRR